MMRGFNEVCIGEKDLFQETCWVFYRWIRLGGRNKDYRTKIHLLVIICIILYRSQKPTCSFALYYAIIHDSFSR